MTVRFWFTRHLSWAKIAHARDAILVADEFCAVLDRISAKVVARCLRKTINAQREIAAIVATSHDDLEAALEPDLVVCCDFGRTTMGRREQGK